MARDLRKRPTSARVVRIFECGLREIEFSNGRRQRIQFYRCVECCEDKQSVEFQSVGIDRSALCKDCIDRFKPRIQQKDSVELKQYMDAVDLRNRQLSAEILRELGRRRAAKVKEATPIWVNKQEIAAVYAEAKRMTIETGIKHHVDHIWPIQHDECCGLHVPWNLRVIPATENLLKSNRLPNAVA